MTNDYAALLTRAAMEIEGVTSVRVTVETSITPRATYRVSYRGSAQEAVVYATLNFRTDLRPPNSTLFVVKLKVAS